MWVSARHKFVYLAPPHTASRTLAEYFHQHYGAVICPSYGNFLGGRHHKVLSCLEYVVAGYRVVLSVRQPLRRVLSHWACCLRRRSKDAELTPDAFTRWVTRVCRQPMCWGLAGMPYSLCCFLEDSRLTAQQVLLVRTEQLGEDVARLPFFQPSVGVPEAAPEKYRSSPVDYRAFFAEPAVNELVTARYVEDYLTFGYRVGRDV